MLAALIGILIGLIIGIMMPIAVPAAWSPYISVGVLASVDAIFGGIRADLQGRFRMRDFLAGFFGNALLAVLLAYVGDRLDVPLYLAAVLAFGTRIFKSFSIIRKILTQRISLSKLRKKEPDKQ